MWCVIVGYLIASYSYALAWYSYATAYDDNYPLDWEPGNRADRMGFLGFAPFWFWFQMLKYLAAMLPRPIQIKGTEK